MAEAVGVARDWAVILLAVETLILSLAPLYLYWKATQGLGKLLPHVRPFFGRVRSGVDQGARGVRQVAGAIERPFVIGHSARAAVRAFWSTYRRRSD